MQLISRGFSRARRVASRRTFAMSYYRKSLDIIREWSKLDTEDSNFYYELTDLNFDQLTHTVSNLTGTSYSQVKDLLLELQNDNPLREHIKKGISEASYGKDIQVEFGRRLGWYAFARILKPRLIVETGVDHGVGSCVLIRALMRNKTEGFPGTYIGTDINPHAGKLLMGEFKKFGKILYGDSIESLKTIDQPIDLFINDSDHSAEYEYKEYRTIKSKLSNKAIILGDNSHVTNKLSQFSIEENRKFLFFSEKPKNHWYPGGGIGISF